MKLGLFSFFSGMGLLDLGFEKSGFFEHKLVNEYFEPFLSAYKYSREAMKLEEPQYGYHNGDIQEFFNGKSSYFSQLIEKSRQDSPLIGFIGGPPCPDFSVGGKNRGSEGVNGRLSAIYFELIAKHQPDFFLFENVKGLWRTAKHREFYEQMKFNVEKAGYVWTERLVNAVEYGVPQDRDRIILLGFKRDLVKNMGVDVTHGSHCLNKEYPWRNYARFSRSDVMRLPWPDQEPFEMMGLRPMPEGILAELTVEHWFGKNDVSNHPNSDNHFIPRDALVKFLSIAEGDSSKKSFKRLHRWRYSPTVAYGNNEVHLHPYKARRLSIAEALSLQSAPKELSLPPSMTLSNMFKTVGNAVPYLMGYKLAQSIADFLGKSST